MMPRGQHGDEQKRNLIVTSKQYWLNMARKGSQALYWGTDNIQAMAC
jgi:hypothetical protein